MNTDRNNFATRIGPAYKAASKTGRPSASLTRRLFNTPRFGLPNATIGVANAGVIETVINPERQLQFALRLSF